MLTQIQKSLGANPENSVEETHSLANFLRKNMETYDEEIAKDILATQNAQTRSKIVVNDDGKKESAELTNAKRKLENDRAKEREIQRELKELKDIELMTTELELAKYLATENARHQAQYARALSHSQPPAPPPPPPPPIEYAPIAYQQPSFSYMPAPVVEVPRQPVVMATPWQQYSQPITYAYNPSHITSASFRNEMDVIGNGKAANVYSEPSFESMRAPQVSLAHPSVFQQAIEVPRPSSAIHAKAQSRHTTKPTISKPNQNKQRKPFSTRFYPKSRPYAGYRVSSSHREQPVASLMSRKPTLSFPGPTYSPPPLWARAGGPQNRFMSYSSKYNQQRKVKPQSNQALKSFFTQQQHVPSFSNMYKNPTFLAQQHGPLFTEEAYKLPMAVPMHYHIGAYHAIEKEQPHFDIHVPFTTQITSTREYPPASAYQRELLPSKTQIPASNTQFHMPDYARMQNSYANQYPLPRPQVPSFVSSPRVMYQAPTSFAETVGSLKEGIPFYAPYYTAPQPVAPVQQQYTGYSQTSQPFETMNTDSENFNPSTPPKEKLPVKEAKAKEQQERVPLGYGLYPLPENAEGKMDDKEGKMDTIFIFSCITLLAIDYRLSESVIDTMSQWF